MAPESTEKAKKKGVNYPNCYLANNDIVFDGAIAELVMFSHTTAQVAVANTCAPGYIGAEFVKNMHHTDGTPTATFRNLKHLVGSITAHVGEILLKDSKNKLLMNTHDLVTSSDNQFIWNPTEYPHWQPTPLYRKREIL